ncbi:hypothetical protein, partial [Salmonella enterica]|uniref:hypothetical protein n=1 Tax=Salmonella enterica TaxID=28901 RepID=UPI001CB87606
LSTMKKLFPLLKYDIFVNQKDGKTFLFSMSMLTGAILNFFSTLTAAAFQNVAYPLDKLC